MDVVSYTVDTADQFWAELEEIADGDFHSSRSIQQVLYVYLTFASTYMGQYLVLDEDLTRCAWTLIKSKTFSQNRAYARRKLINMLVLDDDTNTVQQKILIGGVLLVDGRFHKSTLEMMQEEAAMNCVISTLWTDRFTNVRLHRIFLELLYEMCRVQRIRVKDLNKISYEFIEFLFAVIEGDINIKETGSSTAQPPSSPPSVMPDTPDSPSTVTPGTAAPAYDPTDPYNNVSLRALLALNEQYMIAGLAASCEAPQSNSSASSPSSSALPPNKVFDTLRRNTDRYPGFGENLVFAFNRGADNTLQLMMLKLLYLVFTTPATYQYLYINDVKVLVDIFLRELDNLPREDEMLRNSYLRVLSPMLQNTGLKADEYKKNNLVSLLQTIACPPSSSAVITETTQRLAWRCLRTDWLGQGSSSETSTSTSSASSSQSSLSASSSTASFATANSSLQSLDSEAPQYARQTNYTSDTATSLHPTVSYPVDDTTSASASLSPIPTPSPTPPPPPPRSVSPRTASPRVMPSHPSHPSHTNTAHVAPRPPKPRKSYQNLGIPKANDVRSSSVVDIATTLTKPASMEYLTRVKSPRPPPPPPRKVPTPLAQ